jgi:XTP/dITP diphosphohydrolase
LPTILVASSNPGKIAEMKLGARLWGGTSEDLEGWIIDSVPGLKKLPPCAEDADSYASNAQKKALHYSQHVAGLVLGDDSGLEVAALGGAPGPRSARYAGPAATDAENNAKLLQELIAVPPQMRTARFVCELALARSGKPLARFGGVVEGFILGEPRGREGFGYDPLFLDPMVGRTFAELKLEEKMQRSHRGKAFRGLLEWLANQPTAFWSQGDA